MLKFLFILSFCLIMAPGFSQIPADVLKTREQAMQALHGFNPASVIDGYTINPHETALNPQEGSNALSSQGLNALNKNPTAFELYQNAGTRSKGRYNPNSPEMRYAENLLENPENVLEGVCYKEPVHCETISETKTCQETLSYKNKACTEQLTVTLQPLAQQLNRVITTSNGNATFDVTRCAPHDKYCTKAALAELTPLCETLTVSITYKNKLVQLIKQPTCADPTVSIVTAQKGRHYARLSIHLTQWMSEDKWSAKACDAIRQDRSASQCILNNESACLEPNAQKTIQGVGITRPCWGRSFQFQCSYLESSSCTSLMMEGCSQRDSQCVNSANGLCSSYEQTFTCFQKSCLPEKTVCPGRIGCSDGSCDLSEEEVSDDAAEGLSRLGVLAGSASEVAAKQIHSGVPSIFTGNNSTCRKVKADVRNCCKGSYQMTHCSEDEKRLAKAKEEGRAFKVGKFCALKKMGMCLEEKQSWCVFPTKLAAIIQIQGRYSQLGIAFGWAKDEENHANCRGITPEELERINFSALDLSPIEQELMNRKVLPNEGQVASINQSHIERLKQMERSHD
ncbi:MULTISPECIES: conjugal transfer protein TraN [Legionella]|uniref:Conjugal transfer protein TraN n=2 Tax=Legionella TaxID=445 RepID=A0A2H5FMQ7_9GAMM|nr:MULTISPECIES: conjugal transfer protein TraN [Legionella]AUH72839.1 conjugal transfer protein TraN [Legionella sainthelensi]CBJ12216.1 putative conjugative transfer protein TraN [Legionella longbeachae NSW150]